MHLKLQNTTHLYCNADVKETIVQTPLHTGHVLTIHGILRIASNTESMNG